MTVVVCRAIPLPERKTVGWDNPPMTQVEQRDQTFAGFAVAFVVALTKRRFRKAHSMLSQDLKRQQSIKGLQAAYDAMVKAVNCMLAEAQLVETMTEWPTKAEDDAGWAYVAITWDRYSEAVAVVVQKADARFAIRKIEWGRP